MIDNPLNDPILVTLGPVALRGSVATTWVIMGALVTGGAIISGRRFRGSLAQQAAIDLVALLSGELDAALGRPSGPFLPFLGTLFLLIAAANLSSLMPGVEPPTARPETTAALALVVMAAVQVYGLRMLGLRGYGRHFLHPNPLFLPLNIASEFTRVLSLMMRLFGNMMSHGFVIAILLSIVGFLVPIPFMALGLMIGVIQAYIFTILAAVYIGAATHSEEDET